MNLKIVFDYYFVAVNVYSDDIFSLVEIEC